jgi:hypothetical protein
MLNDSGHVHSNIQKLAEIVKARAEAKLAQAKRKLLAAQRRSKYIQWKKDEAAHVRAHRADETAVRKLEAENRILELKLYQRMLKQKLEAENRILELKLNRMLKQKEEAENRNLELN